MWFIPKRMGWDAIECSETFYESRHIKIGTDFCLCIPDVFVLKLVALRTLSSDSMAMYPFQSWSFATIEPLLESNTINAAELNIALGCVSIVRLRACAGGRAAADVPFPLCGSMRRRAGTDTRVFHRNVSSLYPTTANILFSTQNFFSLYLLPGDDINENGFWISGGSNKAWTKYSTTRTNFINIFGQVTHIFLLIEPDIPKIQHVKEKAKPRVDLLWLSDESSLISNVIKITT